MKYTTTTKTGSDLDVDLQELSPEGLNLLPDGGAGVEGADDGPHVLGRADG